MINLQKHPKVAWRTAAIPKKSGGKRFLIIPGDELKAVQLDCLDELYHAKDLKPTSFAVGFVPFRNTVSGALKHKKDSPVIICMDMHNFFPSFPVDVIREELMKSSLGAAKTEYIMRYCVFHGKDKDQCPQGAPTSPYLTNIGMRQTDLFLNSFAKKHGFTYSRYADDIAFAGDPSNPNFLLRNSYRRFIEGVKILVGKIGLHVSNRKTHVAYINSPRVPRRITGVVLRKDGQGYNAPHQVRKEARQLTFLLWKALMGGKPKEELITEYEKVKGLVTYCDYIRSYSDAPHNTADPMIPADKFELIERTFNEI